MIRRSAWAAASCGRLARRRCARSVPAGALSATLGGFMLELGLLGRERRDLRRASFCGTGPAVGRLGGHCQLVLGSHHCLLGISALWFDASVLFGSRLSGFGQETRSG